MNITIKYIKWSIFDKQFKRFWFYNSRQYLYCKGMTLRFFGWNFNITEKNATKKLINKL